MASKRTRFMFTINFNLHLCLFIYFNFLLHSNQHAQASLQILVYRVLILCDKYCSSFPVSAYCVNVAHSAIGPCVGWNSGGK